MVKKFIESAKKGNSVFVTDVRDAFTNLKKKQTLNCVLDLIDGSRRVFELNIPALEDLDDEQTEFVKSYIRAEVYNILSALGGMRMTIYLDTSSKPLAAVAKELNKVFCVNRSRSKRSGYGKCINVIDRMLGAIIGGGAKFEFIIKDSSEAGGIADSAPKPEGNADIFKKASEDIKGKAICGLDIGGTSVKVAIAVDGNLCCLKEYGWFPESFMRAEQLTAPVCMLVRLMRAQVSLNADKELASEDRLLLQQGLTQAMHRDAGYEVIAKVVGVAEKALKDKLLEIDGW